MTLLSVRQAEARGRSGFGVAPLLRQVAHVFRIIHRGIVAAKMRRLRSELMFHSGGCDARFERPPIPREKWDY